MIKIVWLKSIKNQIFCDYWGKFFYMGSLSCEQGCQNQILEIRSFSKKSGVDQEIFSKKSGGRSEDFFSKSEGKQDSIA